MGEPIVEMRPRRIDLDQAMAEEDGQEIHVLFAGTTYRFPGTLSAKVVYQLLGLMDDKGDVATSRVPQFWATLVGPERLEAMLDSGLTWKQLQQLQRSLLVEYGLVGDTDGEPNPPM